MVCRKVQEINSETLMNKMQLVIPMSGFGERFRREGYKVPKPLIEIEGKPIISHVVDIFPKIEKVIFICNKEHINSKEFTLRNTLKKLAPKSKIVEIDPHKKGPIYAVLQSIAYIDKNLPTIVNYCDFNCIWNFEAFKNYLAKKDPDGCVISYTGFHPHMLGNTNYAYLKVKGERVDDIQEKKPFTKEPMKELASSGTYYFKSGQIMENYFKEVIKRDLNVKGEYYVSLAYKPMIEDGLKIGYFLLEHFMQWGTPSDFEEYKWFSSLFSLKNNKLINNNIIKGSLMIPAAGKGSRFKEKGFKSPKPLIKVSDKAMIIQAIDDMPKFERLKVVLRKNLPNLDEIIFSLKNQYSDIKYNILEDETSGQATTCLNSIDKEDIEKPLTISACDNGVIYKFQEFYDLYEDKNFDIIVWGCKNYPGAIKNPHMYGWIDEKHNVIKSVSVKKPLKNPKQDSVIIGTFTFKKAKFFVEAAEDMINKNQKVNGEFFVDSCINNAIALGYKVALFNVDYFLCWGTPQDLRTYNYWQDCFEKSNHHNYKKSLDPDFI